MSLFRRQTPAGLAALFAFVLPFAQAHAKEDCAQFSGSKHCATGDARLEVEDDSLYVHAPDASGEHGVRVDAERAKAWSAGVGVEPSEDKEEGETRTLKTYVAKGQVVAMSSVTETAQGQSFAASFVNADGKPTTYTAKVFLEGKLMVSVSGIKSGEVGVVAFNSSESPAPRPSCTTLTRKACMKLCGLPLPACAHCLKPCRHGIENDIYLNGDGSVPYLDMSFESPFNHAAVGSSAKAAPEIVEGDRVVLVADEPSAGEDHDVDQVFIHSTSKTVELTGETTTRR
ncbi:hypothetical protein D7Y13_28440 [Corallococcus praedator]|uniref:Uncharacterized protein n=1 Tax=Corallococcus praedator TaxID=2316724 RepID=A0ABX9QB95_9BACT|nr:MULTISPECIES: hypothetical protein [Corallococcus]RKH09694.1 hypothetical protein D7X74_29090 [Corallococcus sp. CA047B]RKH23560.1 hypothetical protein D7X75_33525 [Corallococcus sp. CA031C]RKH98993.1 hypothetical protein D7Y13_28440 [Corallococcus praedator]